MTNTSDSSPCFEVQIQATCRTNCKVQHMFEEQTLDKDGTTSKPNQSSHRILWRKEFSEELEAFIGREAPQHWTPISN